MLNLNDRVDDRADSKNRAKPEIPSTLQAAMQLASASMVTMDQSMVKKETRKNVDPALALLAIKRSLSKPSPILPKWCVPGRGLDRGRPGCGMSSN